MARARTTNLRLFADDHALQDAGVAEGERVGDGAVARGEGCGTEWRGEHVQAVANLVDALGLGFEELAGGRKGVFLEEEADGGARVEEVVVADVGRGFAGGEFGERVGFEGEVWIILSVEVAREKEEDEED